MQLKRFVSCLRAMALTAGLVLMATSVARDQRIIIQLEAPDGTVSIQGRLLAVEDGCYVIQTADLNTLRVAADRIDCISTGCPPLQQMMLN